MLSQYQEAVVTEFKNQVHLYLKDFFSIHKPNKGLALLRSKIITVANNNVEKELLSNTDSKFKKKYGTDPIIFIYEKITNNFISALDFAKDIDFEDGKVKEKLIGIIPKLSDNDIQQLINMLMKYVVNTDGSSTEKSLKKKERRAKKKEELRKKQEEDFWLKELGEESVGIDFPDDIVFEEIKPTTEKMSKHNNPKPTNYNKEDVDDDIFIPLYLKRKLQIIY